MFTNINVFYNEIVAQVFGIVLKYCMFKNLTSEALNNDYEIF